MNGTTLILWAHVQAAVSKHEVDIKFREHYPKDTVSEMDAKWRISAMRKCQLIFRDFVKGVINEEFVTFIFQEIITKWCKCKLIEPKRDGDGDVVLKIIVNDNETISVSIMGRGI